VSRKAEVTITGKAGELAAGQKAKIDYEKTLESVTKIEATGEIPPSRVNQGVEV
jgi:hypothetical protein